MRTGTRRNGMGLVVLLLALSPALAQEVPLLPSPFDTPEPGHNGSVPRPWGHECEQGPGGLFFTAEYLLLKPRRRALDFVIIDPVDNGLPDGIIESLDLGTRSGFRAGGGLRLPGEQWEIGVYYTYLQSADNRRLAAPAGGTLYATLTRPGTIEEVTSALALASLKYDVVDAEIGRRIPVSDTLTVRLFGGTRAAWIDQRFDAYYNGRDANQAHVVSQVNMDGFGLRLGAEGYWMLGKGFSVFGRGSGSLLIGDFRARLFQSDDAGVTIQTNLFEKYDGMVPVTELGVGVGWEGKRVRLRAGYELINWFNMVDLPDVVDDVHVGKTTRRLSDLSLQGLFVELGLMF